MALNEVFHAIENYIAQAKFAMQNFTINRDGSLDDGVRTNTHVLSIIMENGIEINDAPTTNIRGYHLVRSAQGPF